MSKEKISIQDIINWCDKMVAEGRTPIIKWEGGNDSGWVYMEDEDGARMEEPEAEALIDRMYDELDYGSWAGDFSSNGEAMYDPATKSFEGTDYYSETERDAAESFIRIAIPAFIPFDRLEIETEGQENIEVSCALDVHNTFVHPNTEAVMNKLTEQLKADMEDAVDKYFKKDHLSWDVFSDYYSHYVIDRNDFKREGDELVHILENVEFNRNNTVENLKLIDLKELLENEH